MDRAEQYRELAEPEATDLVVIREQHRINLRRKARERRPSLLLLGLHAEFRDLGRRTRCGRSDPRHRPAAGDDSVPTDIYGWERLGTNNQNPHLGWMEGAWMLKHGGKYYLTYSAGGTQYPTYAMGCTSDFPLGPFVPQKRNPIFRTTAGLITGTAHGAIVRGPQEQLWTFYTIFTGVVHGFERRVGMDLAEIDANGELHVPRATSTPQPFPGVIGSTSAWLPLNELEPTFGSSHSPNTAGLFAVDNNLLTTWLPAPTDTEPSLTTAFSARATIRAARVIWRDVGLDTPAGVRPGRFRYRIEAETAPGEWTTIVDRSKSEDDLLIDYRECTPTSALRARLVIVGYPSGIAPAATEFTLFGDTDR